MSYQTRLIRIGYTLGISLLLAAIIYFFAANWGGLERLTKIALSAGLVALFYGCSFLPAKLRFLSAHQSFLARLLLLGGIIAFGVAIALIGQTYNSHADSFGLFMVWSIPALLLAIVTRHSWFYLITYVLLHLTLWYYFFPSSMLVNHSDVKQAVIFGLFAVANLILFSLVEMGRLRAPSLKYCSFIIFHIALLWLSNSFVLGTVGYWLNFVTVAGLAGCFYFFGKVRIDKWALSLTALAASAFAVLKFLELAEQHYSIWFFFYGLVFVALLLTGNVLFFRYLGRLRVDESTVSVDVDVEEKPDSLEKPPGHLAARIVAMIVTVIGVAIGTVSLIGLVMLASMDAEPDNVLSVLSLIIIVTMLAIPRMNEVVRHTVLTIGFLVGIVAAIFVDQPALTVVYMVLAVVGWMRFEGRLLRGFMYVIFNLIIGFLLFQVFHLGEGYFESREGAWTIILLILAAINWAIYGLNYVLEVGKAGMQLRFSGLFFGMLYLYWLTFMDDLFSYSYFLFNLFYFVLATALVVYFTRRERKAESSLALMFWFIFIAFKYYDLVWPLLHKSLTLLIISVIILFVTVWVEGLLNRRGKLVLEHDDTELAGSEARRSARSLPYSKWLPILLIIVLQFGIIGYQTVQNERLLANGQSIKLALQPLDPRSLLQGDYVRLNYEISVPPQAVAEQLEQMSSQSRVRVVLAKDSRGIHVFDRLYRSGEQLRDGEVMLTGSTYGWRQIAYGIESYFIPEGTGGEIERTMRFAYARVGSSGNAILEKLTAE